jgi:hypothetical protein
LQTLKPRSKKNFYSQRAAAAWIICLPWREADRFTLVRKNEMEGTNCKEKLDNRAWKSYIAAIFILPQQQPASAQIEAAGRVLLQF